MNRKQRRKAEKLVDQGLRGSNYGGEQSGRSEMPAWKNIKSAGIPNPALCFTLVLRAIPVKRTGVLTVSADILITEIDKQKVATFFLASRP